MTFSPCPKQPIPRIKPKGKREPAYIERLRKFGCWCCRMDGSGWRKAEAHHPRVGVGMSQKAADRLAIPVCAAHHRLNIPGSFSIHMNPIEWRLRYGSEAEVLGQVLKAMEAEVAA